MLEKHILYKYSNLLILIFPIVIFSFKTLNIVSALSNAYSKSKSFNIDVTSTSISLISSYKRS